VKLPVSAMAMKVRSWSTSIRAVMAAILFCGSGPGTAASRANRVLPKRSTVLIGQIKNIRFTYQ
jgi:ribosomal protein RSM22 (predicted rRNA methylase)